jgi:hypothetical protein
MSKQKIFAKHFFALFSFLKLTNKASQFSISHPVSFPSLHLSPFILFYCSCKHEPSNNLNEILGFYYPLGLVLSLTIKPYLSHCLTLILSHSVNRIIIIIPYSEFYSKAFSVDFPTRTLARASFSILSIHRIEAAGNNFSAVVKLTFNLTLNSHCDDNFQIN